MPNVAMEKTHKVHSIYFNSHLYADAASVPLSLNLNKKYKILVVDDDPVNRMVVKAYLRKQKFNTAEAIDGEDALRVIAEQDDIDLIVLDVMMPRMTGYEACALLRKRHGLHTMPVIFLTANHQLGEVVNAFSAGGSDFLTKPVSGDLLIEKVRLHLSLLEEFKEINAISTADISQVLSKDCIDISSHHYLNLHAAIANIIEQIYCLIAPTEIIGCWVCNDDNNFEYVKNVLVLPAIANHAPISLQEFGVLTNVVNNEDEGAALLNCIIEAAEDGRLGENSIITKHLHCELIFNANAVVGFILLGASTADFMTHEHRIILTQCQIHIAAAIVKKQKIRAL